MLLKLFSMRSMKGSVALGLGWPWVALYNSVGTKKAISMILLLLRILNLMEEEY